MKSKELTVYLILTAIVFLLMLILSLKACSGIGTEGKVQPAAVTPETVIETVRQHSRLYTAEAKSSKTMTYTSQNKLSLNALGIDKTVSLPLGKTEAKIPVTVTYKAYIDLGRVDERNVRTDGETIRIILPDPVIVETSVTVDHDNESQKKQLLGKGLTYEQYQEMVRQAKESAWTELPDSAQQAVIETAKVSATELLIPQLRALGFSKIEIAYREDFSLRQLVRKKE
ncbi:MAG: DUF4230 domain-containing protein [Bacteroidales bacterium]|nr:DUF4230 domain-containing protein [Bacteroidales bacterium]MCM1146790.1 DUF4230 domain-containing protein [Bacteroidales bacterium]MCM1205713.1 DUF4230 domain-containing protein [Bacillota bacterium]MCM1510757.1 DUF4230 domain-containing protein [Clostridium sp.]